MLSKKKHKNILSSKRKAIVVTMLIIVLSVVDAVSLMAQETNNGSTYTLDDLINQTLAENYQIRIMRNQERIASNNNTIGNAGYLPTVGLDAQQSGSIESSTSEFYTGDSRSGSNALSTSLNAMVQVNWVVFDGFKMFARKDRLENLQKLSVLDTRYYVEQTVSDLATAYYELIKEKQLLAHFRQSLTISEYRLNLEKEKLKLGSGNALLYHQAVVDFHSDSVMVENKKSVIQNIEVHINRIINRELESDIPLIMDETAFFEIQEKDSLIQSAVNNNISLEQSKINELLAETATKIEAGDKYPEVSLFGNYSFSQQNSELGFVESRNSFGPQFGVRIRFNLYDGGRENIQLKNAEIEQENAGINKRQVSRQIQSSVIQLINLHDSYFRQYRLTLKSLDAAENSMKIARQQLESGAINGYDFRQTQSALLQVKNKVTELKFAILETEISILKLSGDLIPTLL